MMKHLISIVTLLAVGFSPAAWAVNIEKILDSMPPSIPCEQLLKSGATQFPTEDVAEPSWRESEHGLYIADVIDERQGNGFGWVVYEGVWMIERAETNEKWTESISTRYDLPKSWKGPYRQTESMGEGFYNKIFYKRCVLRRELSTGVPSQNVEFNTKDKIYAHYKSLIDNQALISLLDNAEGTLLFIRSVTPVLGTGYQIAECARTNTLRCWVDAGVSAAGDTFMFMKIAAKAEKLRKLGIYARYGEYAIVAVREAQAAEAAYNKEWWRAGVLGVEGLVRFAVNRLPIRIKKPPPADVDCPPSRIAHGVEPKVPTKGVVPITASCAVCEAAPPAADDIVTATHYLEKIKAKTPTSASPLTRSAILDNSSVGPRTQAALVRWADLTDMHGDTAPLAKAMASIMAEFRAFVRGKQFANFDDAFKSFATDWTKRRGAIPITVSESLDSRAFGNKVGSEPGGQLKFLVDDAYFINQQACGPGDHTRFAHFLQQAAIFSIDPDAYRGAMTSLTNQNIGTFVLAYSYQGQSFKPTMWGLLLDGVEFKASFNRANSPGSATLLCWFESEFIRIGR